MIVKLNKKKIYKKLNEFKCLDQNKQGTVICPQGRFTVNNLLFYRKTITKFNRRADFQIVDLL